MSAYDRGFDAHYNGKELRHNPYRAGTQQHLDWQDGWNDAHYLAQDHYYRESR